MAEDVHNDMGKLPGDYMSKAILLADEEESIATMVTSLLTSKGHRVVRVKSGHEAQDLVGQQEFDLAIVGEQLSDIDGIGWIVKLRSLTRTIKVIFIANEWRDAELYKMLTKDYNVALVVHRPIKPLLFAAQIDSHLGRQSATLAIGNELEEKALTAMRSRFMEVLPHRVSTIADAIEVARAQPSNTSLAQEARRLAHNLKGTASSCGFSAVGEASSLLEKALTAVQLPERSFNPAAWMEIEDLYKIMRQAAETELSQKKHSAPITSIDDDSAMAKILVVGSDAMPEGENSLNNGLPVKVISSSPADAIAKAGNTPLDAVLIDLDGGVGSVTLARELRGMSGYESLPVGFINPRGQPADPVDTTHAGASLYLGKPLLPDALKNGIEYLLAVRQGGRPRILVVDDDDEFSSLIAATLGQEGMLVRCLNEPSVILSVMESFVPDLVLLDVMMPMVSGFDVCRMLRGTSRWQDTPILFLTAQTELEARLAAFDAGGDDYLPKPVAAVELLMRVKVRLERARFIRERADKDALTGLLLRRAFMEQVSGLISEAQRHDFVFTVALMDVDHFKSVNDTYGHLSGDQVLAHFGHLLKRRFRVEDIRGRWGGEEFILALRHEERATTKGALARVLQEFSQVEFKGDHGESFSVTFTAGLASFPQDGDNLEKLVHAADVRLYAGKEAGRNRIVSGD